MDGQKIFGIPDERYRREVGYTIGKRLKGHYIHCKRADRTNKECVAIRRRTRRLHRRNNGARDRSIIDDDGLFETFAEFLSEDSSDEIEGASRIGRDDNV